MEARADACLAQKTLLRALTRTSRLAKAGPSPAVRCREDARESIRETESPKEQPPPESLRQMDRARLTVWKVPPSSGGGRRRGKPARGHSRRSKLSGHKRQTGVRDRGASRRRGADSMGALEMTDTLTQTHILPLDAWHRAQGARMVAFAGYDMPVQYLSLIHI